MLKKQHRITSEKDFKRIYQKGKFFNIDGINIRFMPNRLSYSRVAIVVLKKGTKKAVKRNKVKRQVREIIRLMFLKIKPRFDIVITVKIDLSSKKYQEIEKSLLEGLKRIRLIDDEKNRNNIN
ncbi:MAG: Ribonuclease P protein component [candidate division CPR2 bacterium GW2011_GWC1_39_9]|uniref:Ribonuclease P protein component n=1 Tax=candidate division CPR2 bacterium GW2011_GWC2_39_10 TaxID=1618345 RepID=A0A0G0LVG2_UNCC2|nr:MAG: Ribonuclease P protein component [candidate division CPR2 bacterium GW2011_GWC2_39_10]KKR34260.1 MAG: Ribonuclease P protein component [candidate division CPR2 bacterium GW2011_GWC1_39_9]